MLNDALENVDIAFQQFEFAIKLLSYCELDKIKPSDFDTDHITRLENGTLRFRSGKFDSKERLCQAASINVVTAFSATALTLDQAFEAANIKADPESTDNFIRLRTLVYMVRCAHAHRIADPHWEVRNKYLRQLTIDVNGEAFLLDLTALDGRPFDVDTIGGYVGWYWIRDYTIHGLRKAEERHEATARLRP